MKIRSSKNATFEFSTAGGGGGRGLRLRGKHKGVKKWEIKWTQE